MWVLLSSLAQAAVLRHAVIVGANEGGGNLDPLHYAELDAQRVSEVVAELGGFEVPYVTVLYAPTAAELRAELHKHAQMAGSFDEDLFLFYYSGHADARGLRLGNELYTFEALRGDIRAMPAEVKLGVLDACRSGTITRLKGAALSAPFLVENRLAAEGEAWMTATSADESAQESDKLRGSFFTHYLLSGLRGAADGGDGDVSLAEAYQYAYDRVVDHTGGTEAGAQHPNMDVRLKMEGDLALTRVAEGRATVTLPDEIEGDVTVLRMPDRTPVAEVAKKPGRAVTLALSPGTYKFRLAQGREIKEAMIGLSDGSRVVASRWGTVTAEAASAKGGPFALDAMELARQSGREGVSWAKEALNPGDLRHSPMLAGAASVGLPGAGQFYNGQWVKGGLLFAGTFALAGGSLLSSDHAFFRGSITGPDYAMLGAAMLYGAAIADASYQVNKGEAFRPMRGFTLSSSALWNPAYSMGSPWTAGMNGEWLVAKGLSLGLDRVGWTGSEDGRSAWNVGSRLSLHADGKRWRPGIFASPGVRVHTTPAGDTTVSPVMSGGADLRWYVTPRYFVEQEARVEFERGGAVFLMGGGLGVHFGK